MLRAASNVDIALVFFKEQLLCHYKKAGNEKPKRKRYSCVFVC